MSQQNSNVQSLFQDAAKNVATMTDNRALIQSVEKAVDLIVEGLKNGGTLYTCGNGGSAGDAQAMATELMVKLHKDRSPIRAVALSVDTSVLTAIGNDFGYEYLFDRQVKSLMRKNDILFAITTSGNSPNVLHALRACRELGAKSILMSGGEGGKAAPLADLSLLAPGSFAGPIQECHIVIYHAICTLVERRLSELGQIKYEPSYPSPVK